MKTTFPYFVLLIILLFYSCGNEQNDHTNTPENDESYLELTENLLTTWTDAMLEHQIHDPTDTTRHGALDCPACNKIHGRCMDAVYPFMYMAEKTGEEKYMDAAIAVMDWSKNVSMPDGSWTVIPDPKSWRGISVFGAIALAEALKNHGHILSGDKKQEWTERLERVGEYIYDNFYMGFSHINYGITSIYALHLLGEYLDKDSYKRKAAEMAKEIPKWVTPKDSLLFGEDSPADKRSAKGLLPVDLGYNVEETLNGAVIYAVETQNEQLLSLLGTVMEQHLEFLLPDGAWDNSWGTRQNKWSYWGSRTTDGCQPAFSLMADRNPALGSAAYLNTELLRACTVDGLLAGGPHYQSHDVKPCIHHTFAHAKSLAFILDHANDLPVITKEAKVPRASDEGIKHFEDIDVYIASKGPWTATVSAYDNEFKTKGSNQATGGSLSMLYHEKAGPILVGSMAKYKLAEKNNQQPQPGQEFATTPRLEVFQNDDWFTNLYDLKATVSAIEDQEHLTFNVFTTLRNADRESLTEEASKLSYSIFRDSIIIQVPIVKQATRFVIPIVSPSTEAFEIEGQSLTVNKPESPVIIYSSLPLTSKEMEGKRIFNMVPGVEVIPLIINVPQGQSLHLKMIVK